MTTRNWLWLLLILLVPVAVVFIIQRELSPTACFLPTSISAVDVERAISGKLQSDYEQIQALSPIIQFGNNWFKYRVSLENDFKLTLVIDETKSSSVGTSTIVLITQNGTTTVPFGSRKQIATGITADEIPNLMSQYFYVPSIMTTPLIFPPNTHLSAEVNTGWPLCIFVSLESQYLPLVYFACLIFEVAFLVLVREILTFALKGPRDYFSSR